MALDRLGQPSRLIHFGLHFFAIRAITLDFMPTQFVAARKPGNTRVTGKEQFYTPADLAFDLVGQLSEIIPDLASRTVVEPAGGTGAFIEAALKFGVTDLVSFDIEPHHPRVLTGDFVADELASALPTGQSAVTISNPPFGRNNSLSIPFFNRAAAFSEYICFIVPRSWRKWSVMNRLDSRFHLVQDVDLQIDYVDASGERVWQKNRLSTCFQVWKRENFEREPVRVRDMGLIEKVSPAEADVSLTVFGYNCGRVRTEFDRVPNSTQMFLKMTDDRSLAALQSVDFSRFYRNTAYTEALSLQEINFLLNEAILGNPHLEKKG